jgi:hypothetical protein
MAGTYSMQESVQSGATVTMSLFSALHIRTCLPHSRHVPPGYFYHWARVGGGDRQGSPCQFNCLALGLLNRCKGQTLPDSSKDINFLHEYTKISRSLAGRHMLLPITGTQQSVSWRQVVGGATSSGWTLIMHGPTGGPSISVTPNTFAP